MRYEMRTSEAVIRLEEGEEERRVLRHIVKASFLLARPSLHAWEAYDPEHVLSDEEAESLIARTATGTVLVNLEVVEGRLCFTRLTRGAAPSEILLNTSIYSAYRGDPALVLGYASALLRKQPKAGTSTDYVFQGESLDDVLLPYGFQRETDEDDWSFRRRAFPAMWAIDIFRAVEVLVGLPTFEWDSSELTFALELKAIVRKSHLGTEDLRWLADNALEDPVVVRKLRTN